MACFTSVFLLMLTLSFSLNHFAGGFQLPEAKNGRIESKPGKRCLLYFWDVENLKQPCTRPDFNFTLSIRLFKRFGLNVTERNQDVRSSQRTDNSSSVQSFSECLYDQGESISCCHGISSKVKNTTSGHEVSFSDFEKIIVAVTLCADGVNSAFSPGPGIRILPWRDPCFTHKPCQTRGYAECHSDVDNYSCRCQYRWTGTNCTVPRNMTDLTYHAGKCLDVSSESDAHIKYEYRRTVEECKAVCSLATKCKSFEFRNVPSSIIGNCTLRNSNSLQYSLVPCDSNLYQLKRFLSSTDAPSTNTTVNTPTKDQSLSTVIIVIIVIIGVIVLAFVIIVIVMKPFHQMTTPSRSHSNLGALPPGTRPGDQEMTPLASESAA